MLGKGTTDRRQFIERACEQAGLPTPKFTHPEFLAAAAEAVVQARKGVKVTLVGSLKDLRASRSEQGYTDLEWRESFLAYLEAHGIAFQAVEGEVKRVKLEHTSKTTVIRSYQRAMGDLEQRMQRLLNLRKREEAGKDPGYVCGRPPYGYEVKDGEFHVEPRQAEAVKLIFQHIRQGKSTASLLRQLQKSFKSGGLKENKPQYWDKVKVRRILMRASLYCRGEYRSTGGHTAKLPHLAFLPKEWAGTVKKGAKPRSVAEVSSEEGDGTLVAAAPSRR